MTDTKPTSRELLRKRYTPPCSIAIFSEAELEILNEHGHWMAALASGELRPETAAQVRFVAVAEGELTPETPHEKVWRKVIGRLELERRPNYFKRVGWHDPAEALMPRDQIGRMSPYHRGRRDR